MEQPYLFLLLRQLLPVKHLSTAYYLHALARCAEKRHQRLGHPLRHISHADGLLIALQSVQLQRHQGVIAHHLTLLVPIHIICRKADAWQADDVVALANHLTVRLPLGLHQVVDSA